MRTFARRSSMFALAGVLALGAVACGDDDPDTTVDVTEDEVVPGGDTTIEEGDTTVEETTTEMDMGTETETEMMTETETATE